MRSPGRPKKDTEPKEKVKKVTVVLDDEVEAAIDKLVRIAKRNTASFRPKSAVIRKAILEAAERADE